MHKVISLSRDKEYWFSKDITEEEALVNTFMLENGLEDELHTEALRQELRGKIKRGVYTIGLGDWVIFGEAGEQVCGS